MRVTVAPAVGGSGNTTALEKESNNRPAKEGKATPQTAINCRINCAEGQYTNLELTLSFVGDKGYEVGVPVDLSKFPKVPWTEDGKVLGITYQGTDPARFWPAVSSGMHPSFSSIGGSSH
jgi:hypothetical protein